MRPSRAYGWPWRVGGERMNPWWRVVYLVLYPPVRALVSLRYRGIGNIPATGPVIVVCDHVSHLDPLLVARFLVDAGRSPRFLAKREVFTGFTGVVMRAAEQIPIDRARDPAEAFAAASRALRAGGLVVIMPEGTITRDPAGLPGPLKTGAARLAIANPGVPVVPVSQWGVQQSIDLYRRRFRVIPRIRHDVVAHPPLAIGDGIEAGALTALIAEQLTGGVRELRNRAARRES
ncbi:lysophospholipid acyltransferase family protein [Nocardia thailandica]